MDEIFGCFLSVLLFFHTLKTPTHIKSREYFLSQINQVGRLVFSFNTPQSTIKVKFARVGRVGWSNIYKVVSSSHLNPPHTPPPPPPLHSIAAYFLPACLPCTYTYYSRYIYYTSATSLAGCSHDFLVQNNDSRWPELPDITVHISFTYDDIFAVSRDNAAKFNAFLVFNFSTIEKKK